MIAILIGLIFVFVNIYLGGINVTPHWLGYALILWGLSHRPDSEGRGSAMTVAAVSALASGVLWVAGLFGYGMTFPLGTILQLLLTYHLLVWCEGLEEMGQSHLIGRLRMSWYALAGASVAAVVLGAFLPPLGWVWSAAAFVAAVFYTYTYFRLSAMVER